MNKWSTGATYIHPSLSTNLLLFSESIFWFLTKMWANSIHITDRREKLKYFVDWKGNLAFVGSSSITHLGLNVSVIDIFTFESLKLPMGNVSKSVRSVILLIKNLYSKTLWKRLSICYKFNIYIKINFLLFVTFNSDRLRLKFIRYMSE